MSEIRKTYKPEIQYCPKCGTKLVYKHAISKKMIYFSSGKHIRIINLGYGCPSCMDQRIYASQTANKFAFRGYTYSVKLVLMIVRLKEAHKSREEICDYLYSKNIDISDRNVDMLYQEYLKLIALNYEITIPEAIEQMENEYHQIAFSIDIVTVFKTIYILVYNYFNCKLLALKSFNSAQDLEIKSFFSTFLNPNKNITYIASIRRDNTFIPLLKSLCPSKTKFISFNKF